MTAVLIDRQVQDRRRARTHRRAGVQRRGAAERGLDARRVRQVSGYAPTARSCQVVRSAPRQRVSFGERSVAAPSDAYLAAWLVGVGLVATLCVVVIIATWLSVTA